MLGWSANKIKVVSEIIEKKPYVILVVFLLWVTYVLAQKHIENDRVTFQSADEKLKDCDSCNKKLNEYFMKRVEALDSILTVVNSLDTNKK